MEQSPRKQHRVVTEHEARVFTLSSHGEGMLLHEDKEITLPFCLPGETVAYERVSSKRNTHYYYNGITKASAERQDAPCAHFTRCGGCLLQHMTTDTYREFKHATVVRSFVTHGLDQYVLSPTIFIDPGQRRRVNMEAVKKNDRVFLGFHRYKSHQIISLTECHTMHPDMAGLLLPLKDALDQVLENFQKASLFITRSHVGIDFHIEIQGVSELSDEKRNVLKKIAEHFDFARLQFRHRKFIDLIHFKTQPVVLFDAVPVETDAFCFLQASDAADQILTKLVRDEIPNSTTKILDLFCGRGTFTIPLSKIAPVDGFEFDQKSLAALQKAADENALHIRTEFRNLFDNPLDYKELNNYDVIIIDPPRAGAEAQVRNFNGIKTQKIIYISCNPETFARDAKILMETGWKLTKAIPVDQFYWSPHMEVVGIFEK
jgi:23S rRNA (uracil1939-C5)-methyltransferase